MAIENCHLVRWEYIHVYPRESSKLSWFIHHLMLQFPFFPMFHREISLKSPFRFWSWWNPSFFMVKSIISWKQRPHSWWNGSIFPPHEADVGGQTRWERRRGTSQAGGALGVGKWCEKELKTGGKSLKRGKHPKKWGSHQNLGIEALKVSEWHFDGEPENLL